MDKLSHRAPTHPGKSFLIFFFVINSFAFRFPLPHRHAENFGLPPGQHFSVLAFCLFSLSTPTMLPRRKFSDKHVKGSTLWHCDKYFASALDFHWSALRLTREDLKFVGGVHTARVYLARAILLCKHDLSLSDSFCFIAAAVIKNFHKHTATKKPTSDKDLTDKLGKSGWSENMRGGDETRVPWTWKSQMHTKVGKKRAQKCLSENYFLARAIALPRKGGARVEWKKQHKTLKLL